MPSRGIRILLVEDDQLDVRGVKRALKKADLKSEVIVAGDGLEALEKLRGGAGAPGLGGPLVILLDLNMPRMNGLEFLAALRADPLLHHHVVFVLTTSSSDRDRAAAYQEHIAGYMTKDRVGHDFKQLVGLLDPYARVVELEER